MALASLLIDLQLNSASLREGLDSAKAKLTSFGAGVSKAFEGVEDMAKSVKRASHEVAQAGLGLAAVASGAVALAATVDKGIAAEVKNLKNSFTDLAVPIAQMVVPAMRDMAASVRSVADWVAGLSPHTKAMIANFLQVAAVVGGAALVLSKLAAAVGAIAGVIAAITAAPLLTLVAGLAAIAAGALFLHKVWRENWGGIQEKTKSVIEAMSGYWVQFKDFLGDLWDGLIDGYGKVMKFALNSTVMLLEALGKVSKAQAEMQIWGNNKGVDVAMMALKNGGVKTAALELGSAIKDGALSGMGALKAEFLELLKGFGGFDNGGRATRHGGGAASTIDSGHDGMADAAMAAREARDRDSGLEARELAARVKENAVFLDRGLRMAGAERIRAEVGAWQAAHSTWGQFKVALSTQLGNIVSAVGQAAQGLAGKMGNIGQVINAGVQGAMAGGPWGAIIAVIGELLGRLEVFTQFSDMLNKKLFATLEKLNEAAKPLFEMLHKFSAALTPLREVIHSVVGMIFKVITPIVGLIGTVLGSLKPIFTALSTLFDGLGTALGGIIDIVVMSLGPSLEGLALIFKLIGAAINFAAMGIMVSVANLMGTVKDIMGALGQNTAAITGTINDLWMKILKMKEGQDSFDLFAREAPVATREGSATATTPVAVEMPDVQSVAVVNWNEMLTNLPSGYKGLEDSRFRATSAGGGGAGGSAARPRRDAQGAWTNGDDLTAASGSSNTGPGVAAAEAAVALAQQAWTAATAGPMGDNAKEAEALAAAMADLQHAYEQAARDQAELDQYGPGDPYAAPPAAAGTAAQLTAGGIHFHGDVTLMPRDLFAFAQELSAAQTSNSSRTSRRNPHVKK